MKSILFISVMNGAAWGGSEEQWYKTALWMCRNNYKVAVCVFDWGEKKNKLAELEKNGCRIFLLPNKGQGIFSSWRKQKILHSIPFDEYEVAYVNQGGWKDIAHGPFKKLYKKLPPYALSFHSYRLNSNLRSSKVSIIKAWVKGATVCIAATKMIFKMLENEYGIHPRQKEISCSPITFTAPGQFSFKQTTAPDSPAIFLTLGALDIQTKAQDVLIKCFGNIKWKNRNWQLHIYGEGKDKEMLHTLIKELNLGEKVFLKGYTNEVQRILKDADLLIHATHLDAMPISVIEAMAMGLPCIVSNVGDMPDWVQQDYNGFITAEVTEPALSLQLENAWTKKEEWQQMGMHAYDSFLKKYPLPYEEKFANLLDNYFTKKPV